MKILVISLISIFFVTSCVFGFLLYRASKLLLRFDDLMYFLSHDIHVNIRYFDDLLQTPTLSNAPEIIQMQKNMLMMKIRLDEFLNRMEEATNKKLSKETNNAILR